MRPKDVTHKFPAIAARAREMARSDRLFQVRDGRQTVLVKVRVAEVPAPSGAPDYGALYLVATGSECGKDGKALAHARGGHRIAPAHTVTVQHDGPTDLEAHLAEVCAEACARVIRARGVEAHRAALFGQA